MHHSKSIVKMYPKQKVCYFLLFLPKCRSCSYRGKPKIGHGVVIKDLITQNRFY